VVFTYTLLSFEEISDIVANANKGIVLCSVSCFCFSKIEAVPTDIVKTQQAVLLKKNKE
jgi:phosphoribosylaminoimidazole-succinocarboxamide synthase